jgi:VanZ family protein
MILTIDRFLKSRFFLYIRLGQFALALAIFAFAALMPGKYVPTVSTDKTMHFIGNMLLMLSACVALMGRMKLGLLLLMLIPYSLLIEASQWLTPGRQVDLKDVVANMLGLGAGYLLSHLIENVWNRINPTDEKVEKTAKLDGG